MGKPMSRSILLGMAIAVMTPCVAAEVGPRDYVHVSSAAVRLATPVSMLNQCGDPLDGRHELEGIIAGVFTAEQHDGILGQYDAAYAGSGRPIVKDCRTFKAGLSREQAQRILGEIRQLAGK